MKKIDTPAKRVILVLGQLYFFTALPIDEPTLVDPRNIPLQEVTKEAAWKALRKMTVGQILGKNDENTSSMFIKVVEIPEMALFTQGIKPDDH